ncbi:hypothetical protein K469DRAFT_695519 [Zopfia rhizophila CBS 207.26]|uniref:Bacteriophage T5 Orf172 DNA-binding domain-containing protein n=1 Tax=Zopfia rhizophila CBS 207.26 TaxID=1314779 RepID=A0A6A6DGY5_9PEZI|nr:hypothetical protein K469DRAFT_695519 [Zopfia rhizophila CBS 207.26]
MSKGERWIKIGYAKDVDQRIRDLRYSCGIKDLDEYSKCLVPAYLAAKAERLCHVELINFKRILNCGKCKNGPRHMNHKEWFAVSEELATSIVQRWCKFAHQDAYDEEDGNLDDHWRRMASSDNLCGIQGSRVPQDLEEARVHLKRAGENYDSWLNGASGKAPRSSK